MKKNVRSSNIELIRIFAMAMIVVAHVVHNGVRFQLVDKTSIARMQNGFFCNPVFYKRLFLISGVLPWGNIANAVFILIAGYFMVERGRNIDLGKTSKKLLLQVGFAVLLRILVPLVYYKISSSAKTTLLNMGSINEFNSLWWFPGYYLLVVVVGRLFLNEQLNKIGRASYRNVLLVVFAVFSLCWPGGILNSLADGFRTLALGVFLYALGGYIKLYNPFARIRSGALFLIILVTYDLIYLSYYGIVQTGIHSYLAGNQAADFIQPLYYVDNFSLVVVVLAVVLFELFSRIKLSSRIVNFFGGGTLMIYLIHGHGFWIQLVQGHDWVSLLFHNPLLYCFEVFKWAVFTYVAGVLGYFLFLSFMQLCTKFKYIVLKKVKV